MELWWNLAVVRFDVLRRATQDRNVRQCTQHIGWVECAIDADHQRQPYAFIDNVNYPIYQPISGAILDEVIRPDIVQSLDARTTHLAAKATTSIRHTRCSQACLRCSANQRPSDMRSTHTLGPIKWFIRSVIPHRSYLAEHCAVLIGADQRCDGRTTLIRQAPTIRDQCTCKDEENLEVPLLPPQLLKR